MVQNVNPTFVKTPNIGAAVISTGTGSNVFVTVYTGGANGSKITALNAAANGTTAAYDVHVAVVSGSTGYFLGTGSVPISAGLLSGTPAVSLLNQANSPGLSLDSDGNPYLILPSSAWTLSCSVGAASSQWTTGATIYLVATSVGDF